MTTPTSVYYVTGFRNQDNTHGVWEGFHYRETDFTGADFLHGQFTDCIFSNCDFTGVRFDLARFQNVQFSTNNTFHNTTFNGALADYRTELPPTSGWRKALATDPFGRSYFEPIPERPTLEEAAAEWQRVEVELAELLKAATEALVALVNKTCEVIVDRHNLGGQA